MGCMHPLLSPMHNIYLFKYVHLTNFSNVLLNLIHINVYMTTTSTICLLFRFKWVNLRFVCDVRVDQSLVFYLVFYSLFICLFFFWLWCCVCFGLHFFFINAAVSSNFYVINKQTNKQTKKQKTKKTKQRIDLFSFR